MVTRIKKNKNQNIKTRLAAGMFFVVLTVACFGLYRATRSPLFIIRAVEVADLDELAPIDAHRISQMAAVPVGKVNLFDLDLKPIEKRLLMEPWIKAVSLQKRFPQTVAIGVEFRKPVALVKSREGKLGFVDADGIQFGTADLSKNPDYPIFYQLADTLIDEAIKVLQFWERARFGSRILVSSVSYDLERGFKLMVSYPLNPSLHGDEPASLNSRGRATVELGQDIDAQTMVQLDRLKQVFKYLAEHSVSARQIWADTGKKIVVKLTRGS